MDLTTITRVKTHLAKVDSSYDALLGNLITSTSAMVEKYLRRHAQATSRTEYYHVDPFCRAIFLRGVPITSITSVYNDSEREYGSSTLISSDDYGYVGRTGEVSFDYYLECGTEAVKITYTGGMAATAAAFVDAYPDIAYATELQIAEDFRRRGIAGATAINLDGGSTSFVGQLKMLEHVREILDQHALRVGV